MGVPQITRIVSIVTFGFLMHAGVANASFFKESASYKADSGNSGLFDEFDLKEFGGVGWLFKAGGAINSSPVVVKGAVYFGSDDGYLYAVNAADGKRLWRFKTGGKVQTSPVIEG